MAKKVSNKISKVKKTLLEWRIVQCYLSDYTTKLHIRKIARMINASHRAVSLTLSPMEEQGIVSYAINGRNKEYFLNLKNPFTIDLITTVESNRTVALMENEFLIKKLMGEWFDKLLFPSTPTLIFGSYAKGTQNKASDIDILILEDVDSDKVEAFLKEFGKRHGVEMQIKQLSADTFQDMLFKRESFTLELTDGHILLNNPRVFINIFLRYHYGKRP